jgi:outer membrane lipoprotein SlyB
MISAFGVDHGVISKIAPGEYGWSSKEAKKRTMKEVKVGSRMKAGHGNKQRLAGSTAVGTGVGAGVGALEGAMVGRGKGAAIGAGIGTAAGAGFGALAGKAENMERSGQRNIGGALKRGDLRRVKHGERTTAFSNRIVKD